jgi:MFS family permease
MFASLTRVRDNCLGTPEQASKWHAFVAAWLGAFFDGLDATIYVMVLVPALSELLGTKSHAAIGQYGSYVLAIFMLGWATGAIVFGMLADRIGRAKTMMITILMYALCTGLCTFAHSWQELAFYRFLVGCGIGGEIGIGGVILSETWRGKSRLHAMGVMVSAFGWGYLATSLLNLCFGSMGWRLLFLVGVTPALLTFYVRAKLKDTEEFRFLSEARRRAKLKPPALRNVHEKELVRNTLTCLFTAANLRKTFTVVAMASSCIMGYWAVLAWIPAWINQITGTEAIAERSLTTIVMNIGLITCGMFGGKLVDLFGRKRCFFISSVASYFACVGMFTTVKSFGPVVLVWAFTIGAVTILPFVVLFVYVPELFPTRIRGTAFGFSYNSGRVLAALAAIFGGQLITLFSGSYSQAAASVAAVYLLGAVAAFFMPMTDGNVQSAVITKKEEERPAAVVT